MKIEEKLLRRIVSEISNPTVLGRVIQICLSDTPNQKQNVRKDEQFVRMHQLDSFSNVCAIDVAPAVAFFVSLNAETATEIALAMRGVPKVEGGQARWTRFVEFQRGFFLGFLRGVARSEGYTEETLRQLGGYYSDIVAHEFSGEAESSAYAGDLSNAIGLVSAKSFPFVDQFMSDRAQRDISVRPIGLRIFEGFLHAEVHQHQSLRAKIDLWPKLSSGRGTLLVGSTKHP
ncbi:MAG: hypothetical protein V4467_03110 [Patescibacteria group bacterium]